MSQVGLKGFGELIILWGVGTSDEGGRIEKV